MLGFDKQDLQLTVNLLKMNVRDRYLGSSLGGFWAIANPLFMLGLYTFVFGFVLKVRLPGAETTFDYSIWLILGYGPWIATIEALTASTISVVGAAGIVKNMAFKTELLPISAAFVGLISLFVSLVFLLILSVIAKNSLGWQILWLPLIAALQFFLIVSLGLWLSAINVFKRDLSIALPSALTIILFVTPIFYPIESMPEFVQMFSVANPFYLIAEAYRGIFLHNRHPNISAMLYLFILSSVVFYFGLAAFRRAKGHFTSVL
jgi:lipopolysaccharide transport system permease protein